MLPSNLVYALYTASIQERDTLSKQKDTLLDNMMELTLTNRHLERQKRIMLNLLLEKDEEISELNEKIAKQDITIVESNETIQLMESDFKTQSMELQKALAAYTSHA